MLGGFAGLLLYDMAQARLIRRRQRRAYRDSHSPYGTNDGRYYVRPQRQFDGQGSVDD